MTSNNIDVLVVELTNRCDLNCLFCPKKGKGGTLNFESFQYLINENNRLKKPISQFELSGLGNPLLHKNIKEILELLQSHNTGVTIVTNGLNLKEIIAYFDDSILKNVHFCIYLDSIDQERNDNLMGEKVFNKTIESLEYLLDRDLKYDILMRINSQNYNEIQSMLEICKHYRCNLLLPMETFPFVKDKKMLLSDGMKKKVIETIHTLRNRGEPIFKVIHFEQPEGNCTYIRQKRLFINSQGKLSFCHFLSSLSNTELTHIKNKSLEELIKINNKIRSEFLAKKENELKYWKPKRKTASPCSYCLKHFGVNVKW